MRAHVCLYVMVGWVPQLPKRGKAAGFSEKTFPPPPFCRQPELILTCLIGTAERVSCISEGLQWTHVASELGPPSSFLVLILPAVPAPVTKHSEGGVR